MGDLRESQGGYSQRNTQAGHRALPVSQGICVLPAVGRAWEIDNTLSPPVRSAL